MLLQTLDGRHPSWFANERGDVVNNWSDSWKYLNAGRAAIDY